MKMSKMKPILGYSEIILILIGIILQQSLNSQIYLF